MTRTNLWTRTAMTLLLVMLTTLGAWADQVTAEEALQQAQAFLANRSDGPRRAPGAAPQLVSAGQVCGLYVFNTADKKGFVIVSNDDATYPILGFSESGTIDPANIPSNMRAWLQGYADQIAWLQKQDKQGRQDGQRRARRRTGTHSTEPIAPLISTTWEQKEPYNNLCPMYSSTERAVTGCVATAMAQVMCYHQWPRSYTSAIPGYTTATHGIDLTAELPITTFDWENMRLSYYSTPYSEAEANAVATLMQYCGYSILTDYGDSSGGCFSCVGGALKTYFNYDETIKLVYHNSYSEADWSDLIYDELAQLRPVIYCGKTSNNISHAFVCDGYKYENDNDYFHINWGWEGWCDNYFLLSALDPIYSNSPTLSYNYDQSAVVGIENSTNIRITATKVGPHSAVLSWKGGGTAIAWVVAYKAEDDTDFTEVNVTENPFTLTGLTPETKYYVKVRRYSETDNWSKAIYFTTDIACPAPTTVAVNNIKMSSADIIWMGNNNATSYNLRYATYNSGVLFFDDFENGLDAQGWTTVRNGEGTEDTDWQTSDASELIYKANHSGQNVVVTSSLDYGYGDVEVDNWLITPQLELGGTMTYWVMEEDYSQNHYDIYVSTTTTDVNNFIKIYESGDVSNTWTKVTVDLSAYAGHKGYIAFRLTEEGKGFLCIDDITITKAPDICEWQEVKNVTSPYTIEGLTPVTTYNVEIQAVYEYGVSKWTTTSFTTALVLANNATDNSSLIEEFDGESIIVKLTGRTLYKDNSWNTITLPFNVDLTDENCPLYGAKAQTLENATIDGRNVTLFFTNDLTMLEAGVPYIIKWDSGNNIINPVFYGVTIKNSTSEERIISKANGHVKFIGYYDAFGITEENDNIFYMTAESQLKYTGIARTLKACRAYFQFSENILNNARNFVLNFGDGESVPTGMCHIEEITASADAWYSLDGRKLDKKPTAKGVYIYNGRKAVIK